MDTQAQQSNSYDCMALSVSQPKVPLSDIR